MATVFISHSGSDRSLAEEVVAGLRGAGFDIFVDFSARDGLPGGSRWEGELSSRLRRADALVVVVTPAAARSAWCLVEVGAAQVLERPVFPLEYASDVDMPLLTHVQRVARSEPDWLERLVDGLRRLGVDPADPMDWDSGRDPYPGLASFAPADAGVFFGREEESRELLEVLQRKERGACFVAVVGRSGSGKTSLVHAGLLPRLTRHPDRWLVVPTIRPESDPVRGLVRRVIEAFPTELGRVGPDASTLQRELEESPGRMSSLMDELADASSTTARPDVVLVVDQAEALLTQAEPGQHRLFIELLKHARNAAVRVCVVMTLRPELVSGTEDRPGIAGLDPVTLALEPIRRDRLREVIERPAWRAGIDFERGLVERLASDTGGGDALPLLAHTLSVLTENLDHRERRVSWERYHALGGGVLDTLNTRADEITRGLAERGLDAAVLPTMLRFVQISDQDDVVSRSVEYARLDDAGREVVDAFVNARLVARSSDDVGGQSVVTVRVTHEALLRRWEALDREIQRDIDGLRLYAELGRQATDWDRNGRHEDYLLRGTRLVRIDELLIGRPQPGPGAPEPAGQEGADAPVQFDISPLERDYVEASRRRQEATRLREAGEERSRRRRRVAVAVTALIAAVALTAALLQGLNAGRARADADSRALSAAANDNATRDPAAAAMLAMAAYRESPTAEAEQALFSRYIANQNLGAVYSGAPGNLRAAQVSRDGRVVVGLTDNGLLAIWTRKPTGGTEQRQSTPAAEAEAMGLSPDGTTVWLKRREGLTRYDVATGAMRVVGPLDPRDVNDSELVVSADGGTVAAISGTPQQSSLRAWDTATGRVVGDLPQPSGLSATTYGFGPGRTLVIANALTDTTVERWTPGDPTPPALVTGGASSAAVVTGSDTVVTCQAPPFDATASLSAPTPPTILRSVRISDGAVLRTSANTIGSCSGLAADQGGSTVGLLSTGVQGVSADDSASFDLATGRSTTFSSPVHQSPGDLTADATVIPNLVPGPDGPEVAVVSASAVTLVPLPSVQRSVSDVQWAGLVGDGTTQLAVADGGATLVNGTTLESPGHVIATAPRPSPFWKANAGGEVTHGSLMADRVSADSVVVRRLPDLAQVAQLSTPPVVTIGPKEGDLVSNTLAFDDRGDLMVAVGTDVSIWDSVQGRQIAHVDLATSGVARPDEAVEVRPGENSSQLIVVVQDRPDIRFVDIASAREVGRLPVGPDVLAAAFDPSGRWIDLLRRGGLMEVWDRRAGTRELGPLSTVPPGAVVGQPDLAVGFIDGSGDLMIGSGSLVRVYRADSPAPLRRLDVGSGQQINGMSADGQVITTRPAVGSGSTLSLNPQVWRSEICRVIGDRSLTEAETDALPAPVPAGGVCPGP